MTRQKSGKSPPRGLTPLPSSKNPHSSINESRTAVELLSIRLERWHIEPLATYNFYLVGCWLGHGERRSGGDFNEEDAGEIQEKSLFLDRDCSWEKVTSRSFVTVQVHSPLCSAPVASLTVDCRTSRLWTALFFRLWTREELDS